jgi:hypothetical protein
MPTNHTPLDIVCDAIEFVCTHPHEPGIMAVIEKVYDNSRGPDLGTVSDPQPRIDVLAMAVPFDGITDLTTGTFHLVRRYRLHCCVPEAARETGARRPRSDKQGYRPGTRLRLAAAPYALQG